ncbi:hypothetical protein CRM22_008133 [Opisthorchis felineus]|uniref:Uncharacterized protein n=1 Tax=Opisthorchis felineus TaxID=147828 RepID=A0A4S2LKU9_OPIFE|nr:hypothetical protein CRM22_008133 [Opisthorchis felineus]
MCHFFDGAISNNRNRHPHCWSIHGGNQWSRLLGHYPTPYGPSKTQLEAITPLPDTSPRSFSSSTSVRYPDSSPITADFKIENFNHDFKWRGECDTAEHDNFRKKLVIFSE